ncbi:RTA1 like protein-domain-containing protein [Lentinula lateritia]|uniref:RTA1 like protein-domain-containing protein n=1 Tax=Lentinula lateritia TaxID=40482 RepID=A0ABQ8VZM7_9AGAR|nr:RTA1 like protein-domain-containing protein [Lentinula lateritia]
MASAPAVLGIGLYPSVPVQQCRSLRAAVGNILNQDTRSYVILDLSSPAAPCLPVIHRGPFGIKTSPGSPWAPDNSNLLMESLIPILATRSRDLNSFYGYVPTEWICILFVVLYALSTAIHFGQACWYRVWWMIPTACVCGILEILGWAARMWSSHSPGLAEPYEMQITCTILGPTPLIAATFVILGTVIEQLGSSYSRLSPRMYTVFFFSADVISLIVQAVGGAKAAGAVAQNTSPVSGGQIMLGGIAFQLEFFFRYSRDQPLRDPGTLHEGNIRRGALSKRLKMQTGALMFMTICLWIRSVYRTIELADGWTGRIITTQVYFNVLDGAMVTLAIFTLNFAHPGLLLSEPGKPGLQSVDEEKDSIEEKVSMH